MKENKVQTGKEPTWRDIKKRLEIYDRKGLLGLIHDLYSLSRDNRMFLQSRSGLEGHILKPYKQIISKWVGPSGKWEPKISVSKAKKAVSDYKKALGRPEDIAELAVYYCETCTRFLADYGMEDFGYYDAFALMFEEALKYIRSLDTDARGPFLERLEIVLDDCRDFGNGVGQFCEDMMDEYRLEADDEES